MARLTSACEGGVGIRTRGRGTAVPSGQLCARLEGTSGAPLHTSSGASKKSSRMTAAANFLRKTECAIAFSVQNYGE